MMGLQPVNDWKTARLALRKIISWYPKWRRQKITQSVVPRYIQNINSNVIKLSLNFLKLTTRPVSTFAQRVSPAQGLVRHAGGGPRRWWAAEPAWRGTRPLWTSWSPRPISPAWWLSSECWRSPPWSSACRRSVRAQWCRAAPIFCRSFPSFQRRAPSWEPRRLSALTGPQQRSRLKVKSWDSTNIFSVANQHLYCYMHVTSLTKKTTIHPVFSKMFRDRQGSSNFSNHLSKYAKTSLYDHLGIQIIVAVSQNILKVTKVKPWKTWIRH